jgi:hypothetical protein
VQRRGAGHQFERLRVVVPVLAPHVRLVLDRGEGVRVGPLGRLEVGQRPVRVGRQAGPAAGQEVGLRLRPGRGGGRPVGVRAGGVVQLRPDLRPHQQRRQGGGAAAEGAGELGLRFLPPAEPGEGDGVVPARLAVVRGEVRGQRELGGGLGVLPLEAVHDPAVEHRPRVGREQGVGGVVPLERPGVLAELLPAVGEQEVGGGVAGVGGGGPVGGAGGVAVAAVGREQDGGNVVPAGAGRVVHALGRRRVPCRRVRVPVHPEGVGGQHHHLPEVGGDRGSKRRRQVGERLPLFPARAVRQAEPGEQLVRRGAAAGPRRRVVAGRQVEPQRREPRPPFGGRGHGGGAGGFGFPADVDDPEPEPEADRHRHRGHGREPRVPAVELADPLRDRVVRREPERPVGQLPVQIFEQVGGGLVAVGRVRLQQRADDRVRRRRHGRVPVPRRRRLLQPGGEGVHQLGPLDPGAGERGLAGQQLERHRPEPEQVGPVVHRGGPGVEHPAELLRGHVRDRAPDRGLRAARVERQVEVEQHRVAGVGEQHVRRLHVEVEDAAAVGVVEPGGDPAEEPQRGRRVHPRRFAELPLPPGGGDVVGQRGAAEERHADDFVPVPAVDRVDGDDVRVLEPAEPVALRGHPVGHLEDHPAAGDGVLFGEEDGGERPPAEPLDEGEPEQGVAGAEVVDGGPRGRADRPGRPPGVAGRAEPGAGGRGGVTDGGRRDDGFRDVVVHRPGSRGGAASGQPGAADGGRARKS